jgi:hypothetical protein
MISGGGGNMGQGGMGQQNAWGQQNQGYGQNMGGMGGQGYNQNMGGMGMQGGYGGQQPYGGQPNRGGMGALINNPQGYQQPPPMPMMPPPPQNNNSPWGDLGSNNGWGNFNPGGFTQNPPPNPYPSLDSPHQQGGPNPLQMLGQAFGGGQGGMGMGGQGMGVGGQGMGGSPLNPNDQYNLINGMAMLGQQQNNNPYGGGNPYA